MQLLGSEALDYEIGRIPDDTRRMEALAVLTLASEFLVLSDAAETLALALEQHGLKSMDAIHLALAKDVTISMCHPFHKRASQLH